MPSAGVNLWLFPLESRTTKLSTPPSPPVTSVTIPTIAPSSISAAAHDATTIDNRTSTSVDRTLRDQQGFDLALTKYAIETSGDHTSLIGHEHPRFGLESERKNGWNKMIEVGGKPVLVETAIHLNV